MPLRILADENVDFRIVTALRHGVHNVISVLQEHKGIPDEEVLNLARRLGAVLLTEDSDFGKWIFAHKVSELGIIFLRYTSDELHAVTTSLLKVNETPRGRDRGES